MIVGSLGQVYEGPTPAQADIDYIIRLYAQHGQTVSPEFYWTQEHARRITSGEQTKEEVAAGFARYFVPEAVAARKAAAEVSVEPTVAETAGVPSVTQVTHGLQVPSGVTDFLTGEMIGGVPNWLLLGGVATVLLMMRRR